VGKSINHSESVTRQLLLHAALKCFSARGYSATSVQEIVDAANVSKPAMYYYFADKADIFQAVVDSAHDERYSLMQAAASKGRTTPEKLEEILAQLFEYSLRNKEVLRLTFATAFSAPGDAPHLGHCREKGRRNFEFVKSLVEAGQRSGELTRAFTAEELAMSIYGQVNSYIMIRLLMPDCPLNRETAQRIVSLFLKGAGSQTFRARNGIPETDAFARKRAVAALSKRRGSHS
jgi:AcrR family transcriptional regulator